MLAMYAPPIDLLPGALIGYFEAQGIDPHLVTRNGLHWTALDDGTFAMHYLEFVLDEQGKRILVPVEDDDYRYGEHSTFAKRPRLVRVPSLPECAVEVAR